jgi:hypothetical protein
MAAGEGTRDDDVGRADAVFPVLTTPTRPARSTCRS